MKLLSVLLVGSISVLTNSEANSADAIAGPEPLEYVQVCNGYGTGYFFIPGTETCLKVGGQIRTQGEWYDAYNPDAKLGTRWRDRAELVVDSATDTEYGALKTNIKLRWQWNDGNDVQEKLLFANISLGGLTVGKLDSQFISFTNYAGNVANDDVVYDGPYELNQLTYKYTSGGYTAMISLEDSDSGSNETYFGDSDPSVTNDGTTSKANHYFPDVVAGISFKSDSWGLQLVGGYDSLVEEGAIKARVDVNVGTAKLFFMGGWNSDGDKLNKYAGTNLSGNACPVNRADCGWGDWAIWTGFSLPVADKLSANAQVAYTDSQIFAATANLQWMLVKDLKIQPEVSYTRWGAVDSDQWSAIMRFQRVF